MTNADKITVTCACGCGRVGERRGREGYVRACYVRWNRAGRPVGGPPPAATGHAAPITGESARARATRARYRWATRVAVDVVTGAATLPAPVWEEAAECRDLPPGWTPELWFPLGPVSDDVRAACDRCPVRRECLITALIREEADGIWAGLSPDQRARVLTRGRTAAPPQVAA